MAFPLILRAFALTLGQLSDPRFRRVLFLGILLSLVLLTGLTFGLFWLVGWVTGETAALPLIGEVAWLDDLFSWGAVLLMALLSVFLMVPVASAIISFFLDDVAEAVEEVHYPHLPAATPVPLGDTLRDTVNFLGVLIGANLVALVFYLIFAPAALFIFWALNGFLLGREYFTLAAIRRVGRTRARQLRRRHSGTIWLAGVAMAVPLSIPLLNLVIPILGAASFTHLFHLLLSPQDKASVPDPRY
ncbi:EI24 domain-containing protein [Sulfitobacter aestuarii]|uniref:EI24 domain-containing protein n=1 Tax=Sulfitobacter aestuarii TaxID=2161676 RepID=A0ABW5U5E8_9RHOB